VVIEIAVSLVLLVGAGLAVRTFLALLKTDPGFNPDNLLTLSLVLPSAKYTDEPKREAFYTELLQRAKSTPGVESAAAVNFLPLGGSNASDSYLVEGEPEPPQDQENLARYRVCTPGYFQTMGIRLIKGRNFSDQDKAGAPLVLIINEAFARKHWPNGDAVGKRIKSYGPLDKAPWMEIVGVVQDVKHELNIPVTPDFYFPYAQDVWSSMVVVARTKVDPASLANALRQQVWAIDKDQAVFDVRTMTEVRSISVAMYSSGSVMLGIFAGLALLLASIGIYGVMAFAVTQRTQEIGIRMALGARALDVLKLVIKHGMKLVVLGIAIGLVGSWALTRFMKELLFGVEPTDLLTLSVVSLCLLVAALAACYIPARRATKVEPLEALRYE
jgi:putative ABC transport system permease protein